MQARNADLVNVYEGHPKSNFANIRRKSIRFLRQSQKTIGLTKK